MKKIRLYLPWRETPSGVSFFVPTLDPVQLQKDAVVAAITNRVTYRAQTGVLGGKYGVLFTRINGPKP